MSRSNPEPTRRLTGLGQRIGFGKYETETVQNVLDDDPAYFLWLDEHTNIAIASHILTLAQENSKPNHTFKGWASRND